MSRKSLKQEGKDYLISSAALTIALEAGVMVGNWYLGYDSDYLWPLIVGPGYTALRRWWGNRTLPTLPNLSIRSGRLTSGRPIQVNGGSSWLAQSFSFGQVQKTEPRPPAPEPVGEFFWEVKIPQRIRPIKVRETRLLKLCQLGWQRQEQDISHPLSYNYFKEEGWRYPAYRACTVILDVSNLVDNRGQGASGRLLHPPGATVRYAKYAFLLLAED